MTCTNKQNKYTYANETPSLAQSVSHRLRLRLSLNLSLNSMNGLQTTLYYRAVIASSHSQTFQKFLSFFVCIFFRSFFFGKNKQTNLINKNDTRKKASMKTNNSVMVLDITCIISARSRLHTSVGDIFTIHHLKCII